jgi:uncharacterized protein YdcH (DUF465 family)
MTTVDYVEQFNETIAQITQPLVQQYDEINREIEAKEREFERIRKEQQQEIATMRKARTQLRGMLRSINPELAPTISKNGRPKRNPGKNVAKEKVDAFAAWLQTRAHEINEAGGIYASGIINSKNEVVRDDWTVDIAHQSGISKALVALHDRGVVRLDHTGNGGAKFYKVVV